MTITHSDECFQCGKANHNSPESSHVFQLDQHMVAGSRVRMADHSNVPRRAPLGSSSSSSSPNQISVRPGSRCLLGRLTEDLISITQIGPFSMITKKVLLNAALISRKTASKSPPRVQQAIWHVRLIISVVF